MDGFLGFVTLGSELKGSLLTKTTGNVPTDATGNPGYRIYGPSGLMTNGTGSLSTFKDTGTVAGATNASPIVITDVAHGLTTGTRVTISGVGGNTAANGTFAVTRLTADTFSLDGSTGNGAYTSGGTWHVSGLYEFALTPTGGNGYAAGTTYWIVTTYVMSGTTMSQIGSFTVV